MPNKRNENDDVPTLAQLNAWGSVDRELFETVVYREHYIKSIRAPAPGEQFSRVEAKPKNELLKRDELGDYVDTHISAMWFGWCLHRDTQSQMDARKNS